jgi:putative heme-binding domain-containing protein
MRTPIALGTCALLLLAFSAAQAQEAKRDTRQAKDTSRSFFNGKDLTGWEGLPQFWHVHDRALVGSYTDRALKHNTFLCSKKTYRDFELKFQIRLKGGAGNSGVQIRSRILDPQKYTVAGPQADIGQSYWGSLYGENFGGMMKQSPSALVKQVVKQDDFNDYHIKCVGKHVTIKINGQTMVDDDFAKLPDEGIIAWQLHTGFPSMEVTFKNIEFANLSGKPADSQQGRAPAATPAEALKVLKDFRAELLYSVPKETEGSWVNLCVDPKGRLITSDQYGPLYRITPSPLTTPGQESRGSAPPLPSPIGGEGLGVRGASKIEKLDLPLGGAHGLLWAFDSLYVMVNEGVTINGVRPRHGLHRVRSKDGGDTFEKPEFLHEVNGSGEHGCHAILPGPDGKSLYIVCGNMTRMVQPLAGSRVPRLWGEDHLLPRLPDGNGFMAGVLGPGGCIYRVDPDGKNWELVSTGYRNPFDAAFNRQGELFTYDADMEWDMNTPWYRPTRVCLVASGSDYGWRNGAGKWPAYFPDSLPAVFNVGPGSPTGMCFGYGAHFPAKYQEALFLCDWSYGKLYALHLTPDGSAYKGEIEEFVSGSPLPLTDAVVNPKDGALYFTTGGRRVQSGLYCITYAGKEPTAPANGSDSRGAEARALRHRLEAFHGHPDPRAVDAAWPYLGHPDRYIRSAARVAVEHQDPETWQVRAIAETDPARALSALLALVHATGQDPFHHPRKPADPIPGAALKRPILDALTRLDWEKLTDPQRLDLLRIYGNLFNRMGWPDRTARGRLIQRFDPLFPAKNRELNTELCQLLVYLEAPGIAAKALKLMADAPTQEEQMDYAKSLRVLQTGWTPSQRAEYFAWYLKAANYKGGSSFQGFLRLMKADALATLTDTDKAELQPVLAAKPTAATPVVGKPRPIYRHWTLDELVPKVEAGLTRRDFDRGRRLFGEAKCFACHRFDNEGGAAGPDLTQASGRFSVRDLLESIVEPSKTISDQYAAVVLTTTDGKVVTGRIVNHAGDSMMVMTDMLDPDGQVNVNAKKVESVEKSPVSMMPADLLDPFKEDEVLDLVAYLLSRGDRSNRMFAR